MIISIIIGVMVALMVLLFIGGAIQAFNDRKIFNKKISSWEMNKIEGRNN